VIPVGAFGALKSLTGGGAGPSRSGSAHQSTPNNFTNGGLNINQPNYGLYGVIALGLVIGYLVFVKKKP
jgi:hypothetical protein